MQKGPLSFMTAGSAPYNELTKKQSPKHNTLILINLKRILDAALAVDNNIR
jgi:hypothetical protein